MASGAAKTRPLCEIPDYGESRKAAFAKLFLAIRRIEVFASVRLESRPRTCRGTAFRSGEQLLPECVAQGLACLLDLVPGRVRALVPLRFVGHALGPPVMVTRHVPFCASRDIRSTCPQRLARVAASLALSGRRTADAFTNLLRPAGSSARLKRWVCLVDEGGSLTHRKTSTER